jgi:hypothetical protein
VFEKALALGTRKAEVLNSYAWTLHSKLHLSAQAEPLAIRAVELEAQAAFLHTLADIQLGLKGWDGARESMARWMAAVDGKFLGSYGADAAATFKKVIGAGSATGLAAILQSATGDHWQPWREALGKIVGSSDEKVSEAAQAIVVQLSAS